MTDPIRPNIARPTPIGRPLVRWSAVALATLVLAVAPGVQAQQATPAKRAAPRTADYIVAIVNNELVTAGELEQRLARVREQAARNNARLPPSGELRQQVLDALIDERVQITHARENGARADDAEVDRAVANVAAQNQISMTQLRQRLTAEGMDFGRFRNNIRDQIMVERLREREVQARIRITEGEIDALLDKQRAQAGNAIEYNVAQILVTVPQGANEQVMAERRARAIAAVNRVKAGEPFEVVAREMSEDANRAQGGVIGLRPADRLPEVFLEQVRDLKPGELASTLIRTGAGFHALKLVEKRETGPFTVTQTRARHILIRPSAQVTQEAAARRLAEFKRLITSRTRSFEQLAREHSEDGSAAQGGELGWTSPGQFVPEFEEAMNALPIGGVSDPVVSRFGMHLIQVVERRQQTLDPKQQREQARNALREQKFEQAYTEWLRELRARAYIELREPPV